MAKNTQNSKPKSKETLTSSKLLEQLVCVSLCTTIVHDTTLNNVLSKSHIHDTATVDCKLVSYNAALYQATSINVYV